ncbi:MAG TPA: hypothetical protein VKB93_27365 [Thermoanaerobaculia bacterium]|nr:hypothetical protein [Thermoanaerobaculia bacterium]
MAVSKVKLIARRTAVVLIPFLTGIGVALTLFACCCPGHVGRDQGVEPVAAPPIGLSHFEEPKDVASAAHTQAEMHNVLFHVDPTIVLRIHSLRGEFFDKTEGRPLNFDDKQSFIVKIARARIGVSGRGLTDLLNHYVFNYEGTPLKGLRIQVHEGRLVQQGIMHKLLDIPFEMTADVSVTDDGWMRIHPIDIKICNLNGDLLMKAFGISLDEILKKLPSGVRVEKNDLLINATAILPPPVIQGQLRDVELHEDELLQVFDSNVAPAPLDPPDPQEKNWMFFRDGTLRMGKLFFVRADMQVVDTDPRDPFDFFVDYYNHQLVEGFTRNQPDYGLKVFMRDFEDVGKPPQPGERLSPH